jgi:hypothetical protein
MGHSEQLTYSLLSGSMYASTVETAPESAFVHGEGKFVM